MPEEVLILFVMTILSVSVLTLVKMVLSHRKSGREAKTVSSSSDSGSLTTSELEGMMRRAVEQSITGLSGKIEDLELEIARLTSERPLLAAHNADSRLVLDDEVMDVEPINVRRKTRA